MYICDTDLLSTGERLAIREAIESMYCGRMTVHIHEGVKNEKTHFTESVERIIYQDEPCRLSYQESQTTTQGEPARAYKEIRVICAPEVEIPAGSIIDITQHNHTRTFKRSGHSRYFSDHQSIPLIDIKEFA